MSEKSRLEALLESQLDPTIKEELNVTKDQLEEARSIASALHTEGGRLLTNYLLEDTKEALAQVLQKYRERDIELTELVSLLATLDARLHLYNTLKTAPEDVQTLKEGLDARIGELIDPSLSSGNDVIGSLG